MFSIIIAYYTFCHFHGLLSRGFRAGSSASPPASAGDRAAPGLPRHGEVAPGPVPDLEKGPAVLRGHRGPSEPVRRPREADAGPG